MIYRVLLLRLRLLYTVKTISPAMKSALKTTQVPPSPVVPSAYGVGVEEVFLAIARKLVEQREEIEDARDALIYGRRHYSSVHPEDSPSRGARGCTC